MRSHDIEEVLALAATSAEAPIWSRDDYDQLLLAPSEKLVRAAPWVARTNENLVGFAVVRWLPGDPAAEVESVLVEGKHRRQGIGTALMAACMQWAAEAGAAVLRLEVRPSNAAALALYRGLGFTEAGMRRAYYRAPVEDACVLEAPLRSAQGVADRRCDGSRDFD